MLSFKDLGIGDLNNQNSTLKRQNLTSLEGCPQEVMNNFNCSHNKLISLKGRPEIINGLFDCSSNDITSLEYSPKIVKGDYDCSYNKLTSLKGIPEEIKGNLYCLCNELTSLQGCSKLISETLDVTGNPYLKEVMKEIIENGIQANDYKTDEGNFSFFEIKKDFLNYQEKIKQKNIKKNIKIKEQENIKLNKKLLNQKDYGLSI